MTSAAGLDQRAPLRPSRAVGAAHTCVRELVSPLTEDRPLYRDIAAVAALVSSGALVSAVERVTSQLA
jgi:histidine ammonia-lyase